jgi:hypothetical protein
MARRTKRRPFRRPAPQRRSEDDAQKQRRLDAAAEGLMATRSAEQIEAHLADCELLLAEADRAAQLDPSPDNLARYRRAQSDFETAQAAHKLASNRP